MAAEAHGFRNWLSRLYYESRRKAPTSQMMQDALSVLSGRAQFDSITREVYTRIAEHEAVIYVDLADDEWRVVKISAEGWCVIEGADAPVRFRRTKGMLALPRPEYGDVRSLRRFINVTHEQWPLVLCWLVACYRPNQPFSILALNGEQGSAKSTTGRILRALVDPNQAPLRGELRSERDLMIAATNGWLIALDNLSKIPPWLSDALCRLATGGGFATRALYENDEEILLDAMRPILLNGIEELATRSDLLDRTIAITLPRIPSFKRWNEAELWSDFEPERASIFGALLDAVSCALKNIERVRLSNPPRMADFATFATAAEPALGLQKGAFMSAYDGNRDLANESALEASPVGAAIISFVDRRRNWTGTASQLLTALNNLVSDDDQHLAGWPKSAQAMGGALGRLAPNLRRVGVSVEHLPRKDKKGTRLIQLSINVENWPGTDSERNGDADNLTISDNGEDRFEGCDGSDFEFQVYV